MNYKSLTSERKSFFYTGVLLLFLAAIDIGNFIINAIDGQFSVASYGDVAGASLVRVIIIILMAISLLSILLQAILGTKAITEALNPTKARFHISLAKFSFFVNAFALIVAVVGLFGSNDIGNDIFTAILTLLDVVIMFIYIREGNQVRIS